MRTVPIDAIRGGNPCETWSVTFERKDHLDAVAPAAAAARQRHPLRALQQRSAFFSDAGLQPLRWIVLQARLPERAVRANSNVEQVRSSSTLKRPGPLFGRAHVHGAGIEEALLRGIRYYGKTVRPRVGRPRLAAPDHR